MTDWYREITQTSRPHEQNSGIDWYAEAAGIEGNKDFKRLANVAPTFVREPSEIAQQRALPNVPGETERLYVVDNPEYGGSLGTHLKASFADNQEPIIRMAAKARFPNLPETEARKRYGLVKGQVVYQGDDGNLYLEFPSGELSPKSVGQQVAHNTGKLIPTAAGAVTGIVTAPMLLTGPAGAMTSVALTGAAQAAGEGMRQIIGEALLDDPASPGAIVREGLEGATGQASAGGVTGFMNRRAAKDIARLDKVATKTLTEKASRFDVPLTPAETTNLPSLKGQQKALSNLPQSSDIMDDFYRARGEKVASAVGGVLDDVSRTEGAELAGKEARGAAGAIVDKMTAARAAQAKPLYEAAFNTKTRVDVLPVLSTIDDQIKQGARGSIRSTLLRARETLNIPGTERVDTSIRGLHQAKLEIDNMIAKASTDTSIGRVAQAKLVGLKEILVKQIEAASDDYAKARGLYADVSPGIEKMKDGVIGVLSDLSDDALYRAGRVMLDPGKIGPQSVRNARAAFLGAGKEAEWNSLVRSYLQESFETAGREYATAGGTATQGAKFRAAMFGNSKQREILRAAMQPEQFGTLSDLMDVLEATGRAVRVGSDTAWNQEAMREMRRQSGGVARNVMAPHQIPGRLRDWYDQVKLGNYSEKLATVVTSPEGMKKLKQLRQVSPRSARAAVIAANALGILAEEGADSLTPKETALPETYVSGGGMAPRY